MRNLAAIVLLATLAILLVIGDAAARSAIATSPARIVALFQQFEIVISGTPIRCPVVLDGTFHDSISKSIGTLAGLGDLDVLESECRGGASGLLDHEQTRTAELVQWHITYEGFDGGLPLVDGVYLLVRPLLWISILGGLFTCLAYSNMLFATAGGNPASGTTTHQTIRLIGSTCPAEAATINASGTFLEEKRGSPNEVAIILYD